MPHLSTAHTFRHKDLHPSPSKPNDQNCPLKETQKEAYVVFCLPQNRGTPPTKKSLNAGFGGISVRFPPKNRGISPVAVPSRHLFGARPGESHEQLLQARGRLGGAVGRFKGSPAGGADLFVPNGCGSKINDGRGKPHSFFLVHVFPLTQGSILEFRLFEPQPNGFMSTCGNLKTAGLPLNALQTNHFVYVAHTQISCGALVESASLMHKAKCMARGSWRKFFFKFRVLSERHMVYLPGGFRLLVRRAEFAWL